MSTDSDRAEPTITSVSLTWPCCWHCDQPPPCSGKPHDHPCPELVSYPAMAGDPRLQPCQGSMR